VEVEIGRERMRLVSLTSGVDPISVGHCGKIFVLEPGGTLEVLLAPSS